MTRIATTLFLSSLAIAGCKQRDFSDSSTVDGVNASSLNEGQKKLFEECKKHIKDSGASADLHCAIYAVGNNEVYEGKVKVINADFVRGNPKKINTGDTCNISISVGQSTMLGVMNGADYFVKLLPNAKNSYIEDQVYQAFRTFERPLLQKRFKWLGYWISTDDKYNIVAIGKDVYDTDRAFPSVKRGDPIWECTITGKAPKAN